MKLSIAFSTVCLMLAGCGQEYLESEQNKNNKACNQAAYSSTLTFEYTAGNIPEKISASVNGLPVVNECTLGTDNGAYYTFRHGRTLKILFRVGNHAAMTERFFREDGSPKPNVAFQMELKGRSNCSNTASTFYTTSTVPNWKPVYSNNNKACGASGYAAELSN